MNIMEDKLNILVLVDIQRDFIEGSLANKDAQACIPAIVEKIDNFDGDAIILTMDTHGENYLDTPEGKKLPVKHCVYNTWGWQIDDKVQTAIERKITEGIDVFFVPKNTFGSVEPVEKNVFESALDGRTTCLSLCSSIRAMHTIENKDLDIEMCGFCTDICVVSNALILKAFTHDFAEITVDSKCCAGVTPEKHEAALEVMRSCQINVI
jgi:nicotinamidase-related amidase